MGCCYVFSSHGANGISMDRHRKQILVGGLNYCAILPLVQGRRNRSGCSGFGRTIFYQGKNKIPFLQKVAK